MGEQVVAAVGRDQPEARVAPHAPGERVEERGGPKRGRLDLDAFDGLHVVQADGTALPEGLDVVWLSADGTRLERIVGFFGPLQRRAGGA